MPKRMQIIDSGIPGLQWRVTEGSRPEIGLKKAQQISTLLEEFIRRYLNLRKLREEESFYRQLIINIATEHEGWRGACTEKFALFLTPKQTVQWSTEKLRQFLREIYYAVVYRETLHLKVSLPFSINGRTIDVFMVVGAVEKALSDLGLNPQQIRSILKVETEVEKIDEDKLENFLEERGVDLPSGTKKTTTVWEIKVRSAIGAS